MSETDNTNGKTEATGAEATETNDPNFIGQLSEQETTEINMCRQIGNNLTMELGQLEIQKARTLGRVNEVEAKLNTIVEGLKTRFELTDEDVWQVTPEGALLKTNEQAPPQ